MKTSRRSLVVAVACLSATGTWADRIDVNAMIVGQLKKAGKLGAIYKAKTAEDLPAGLNASAAFEGEIGGRGVKFSLPTTIPEKPLVISQAPINNCSSREVTRTVTVNKSSTNSNSVTASDTVETGKEISVTVGYDSPFGMSASATATARQSFSATKTTEQTTSDTLGWTDQLAVPVEAGKAVKVQFVVTEQMLDRVPFTANLVLTGYVSINFLRGQEGFSWVRVTSSSPPANVIKPGSQEAMKLAVCRVKVGDSARIGKSDGNTCWVGYPKAAPPMPAVGMSTREFDILVGSDSSVRLGEAYASDAYQTDDATPLKVCFAQFNGRSLPGYVNGRMCTSEYGGYAANSETYKILRAPATGGVTSRVLVEDYLTEAQRTFDFRGVYTGVNALFGDFLVGTSNPATCNDAVATTKPATSAATASAASVGLRASVAPAAAESSPVALAAAAPNEKPLAAASRKRTLPKH